MKRLEILCIDDDEPVREYLRELLEPEGCRVTPASGADQALQLLATRSFHVITLDLMMPDVSGMELLRKIRRTDPNVAVIILTAYPSVESATDAIELDVAAYLKKPFAGDDLRRAITSVVRKKQIVVRREDEMHVSIGNTIRSLRKSRGLTLKELGRRCDLSPSQLSLMERAGCVTTVSTLFRVASALDVRVADLIGDY